MTPRTLAAGAADPVRPAACVVALLPAVALAAAPEEAADPRALVEAIAPRVEAIRGLRFRTPVSVATAGDAAAREHFEGRLRSFWPEDRMLVEQEAYADLGLLPRRTSLKASLLHALEEQAGGYYDPAQGAFVVLDDMPAAMAPVIVAHELTHALDDQHFDTDGMLRRAGDDGERAGGVAAVVEGSGTLVMTLFIARELAEGRMKPESAREFQESEAGQARRLKAAPQVLQRLLVGPYVLGMRFLLKGNLAAMPRESVPTADLERAFRDPPRSWEQVLHPEKYWDDDRRDPARPVPLPDLARTLGEGWTLAGDGTLGEMILAILTEPPGAALDPTSFADPGLWTNAGAAGWGGDRWQVYRRDGATVTLLATVWDGAADAREFRAALPPSLRRRAVRRGDAVVLVAGEPAGRGRALARAALKRVAARAR
jgi:hypothetical protein